jgi:hypothetical protein
MFELVFMMKDTITAPVMKLCIEVTVGTAAKLSKFVRSIGEA